jgi:hypothetical protein
MNYRIEPRSFSILITDVFDTCLSAGGFTSVTPLSRIRASTIYSGQAIIYEERAMKTCLL